MYIENSVLLSIVKDSQEISYLLNAEELDQFFKIHQKSDSEYSTGTLSILWIPALTWALLSLHVRTIWTGSQVKHQNSSMLWNALALFLLMVSTAPMTELQAITGKPWFLLL